MGLIINLILIAVIILFFVVKRFIRIKRRKRLKKLSFPEEFKEILKRNVLVYKYLPSDLKEELHGAINVFLDEKRFEGCNGLELTDEIKVTISAQACLLLLKKKSMYYPKLSTIIVYPKAFFVERERAGSKGFREKEKMTLSGESWGAGIVVLSWDHSLGGAFDPYDGQNVVYHEFAHQLDQEDGRADGTPYLKREAYGPWARILGKEFKSLKKKVKICKKDVLDSYGASNAAEFFAVTTEVFFEKPKQLKQRYPELYNELSKYYKLDPVQWFK